MEDAKLQALHDTLAQLRGQKGLGTSSQYSWQRTSAANEARHPAAASLPDNALYANFLPEGVYDPNVGVVNDGDGRSIKRDFSDSVPDTVVETKKAESSECRRKRRKEEKKEAAKAAKLEAKRQAKMEEKKRTKKESLKRKRSEEGKTSAVVNDVDTAIVSSESETTAAKTSEKKAKKDKATKKVQKKKANDDQPSSNGENVKVKKRKGEAIVAIDKPNSVKSDKKPKKKAKKS